MSNQKPDQVLKQVIDCIKEIDLECCTAVHGVPNGLLNVKRQFRDQAFQQTGRRLREEEIIQWLVAEKLRQRGWSVDQEMPYPDERGKSCDLRIQLSDSSYLWLEIKLAWKNWYNCDGSVDGPSPSYLSHLSGTSPGRERSFRKDIEKLRKGTWSEGNHRGVCLVGFDSQTDPMDREVDPILEEAGALGWEIGPMAAWGDRRTSGFNIKVWTCVLPSGENP